MNAHLSPEVTAAFHEAYAPVALYGHDHEVSRGVLLSRHDAAERQLAEWTARKARADSDEARTAAGVRVCLWQLQIRAIQSEIARRGEGVAAES